MTPSVYIYLTIFILGTEWEAGIALGGLSCFMTPDLAQDLMDDIISLMCSTRPYVRKRATLVSYKLFLHYPEALRAAMPRLKEKLEDKGKLKLMRSLFYGKN
jgi:AP-3 complex subunit delta-1